jgi:hypothetical protein
LKNEISEATSTLEWDPTGHNLVGIYLFDKGNICWNIPR